MVDPCAAPWPLGSFYARPGVGNDLRRIVDPFGTVWWYANALGCPSLIGSSLIAASLLVVVSQALYPDTPSPTVVIEAAWIAFGQSRVSAWNGGGSD
jgi:hypothetical protein